jgi:hypothetical protein
MNLNIKNRIRDFWWLTLATCVGIGWYVDRTALINRLANSIEIKTYANDLEVAADPDVRYFEPIDLESIKEEMTKIRDESKRENVDVR